MRADPDNDADRRDRAPQAEHRAPIEQAKRDRRAPGHFDLALAAARLARGLRSRGASSSSSSIVVLRLDDGFFGLLVFGGGDAILRTKTQFGKRCGEAELRLLASAALFSSPRHTRTPTPSDAGQGSGAGFKAVLNDG